MPSCPCLFMQRFHLIDEMQLQQLLSLFSVHVQSRVCAYGVFSNDTDSYLLLTHQKVLGGVGLCRIGRSDDSGCVLTAVTMVLISHLRLKCTNLYLHARPVLA